MVMTNALPQPAYLHDEPPLSGEPHDAVARLLIGPSAAMGAVRRMVRIVAPADAPVLLHGPTGSGKEVAARAIHAASPSASGPFIAVNCGAIPAELIESELFGHERGAFTGASERRVGRFEAAAGGTLLLDEIGDMPASAQVRLLRVIEARGFERVGGQRRLPFDGRIIAATHRDLGQDVATQRFRQDLWFRLAVLPVALPPLVDRLEDIPALVTALSRHIDAAAQWDDGGLHALMAHAWPGNVRELRSVLIRAALFHPSSHGSVTARDVAGLIDPGAGGVMRVGDSDPDLRALLAAIERRQLVNALTQAGGIVADAARIVGINRTTFVEKMRRHGLSRDGPGISGAFNRIQTTPCRRTPHVDAIALNQIDVQPFSDLHATPR